ncbi:hypothetical protein SARI_01967 [Salmonella enterica subsp. arizonae serovar 62:z4,z23:-]|uniref:Uncharacterized protein n=1 Tax=Salmonella arizonae (strain ATCC BAA-731 / CDC346-86 / RSK2980) TaxID=41514 RepID=A9MHV7_SALAR|nr:hypothetical protein SARI_01967 [Salmonella enterica subsp. arizonae serovar 62:z4,z23:-]
MEIIADCRSDKAFTPPSGKINSALSSGMGGESRLFLYPKILSG